MAEALGLATSVVAIIEAAGKIIKLLKDMKDAQEERRTILASLSSTRAILISLRDLLDISNAQDPWYINARQLDEPGGPLEQFRTLLTNIEVKLIPPGSTAQKMRQRIMWMIDKDEVQHVLNGMERIKSLINIALQLDNTYAPIYTCDPMLTSPSCS